MNNDMHKVRRERLREVIANSQMSSRAFALDVLKINPTYLSQMVGPKPTRNITTDKAREFEQRAGLEPDTLDTPAPSRPMSVGEPAPPPYLDMDLWREVVRAVSEVWEKQGGRYDRREQRMLPGAQFDDLDKRG